MKLTRLFISLILCLVSTGCIVDRTVAVDPDDAHGKNRQPSEPVACDIENPDCEDGLRCELIDPCGSPCPEGAAEEGLACPQVCIEIYACVQPLVIEDICDPRASRCGAGLTCTVDEGRCGPTDCAAEGCLECPPVYTCQPAVAAVTCDQVECEPGFRCEILVSEGCGYADPVEQRECEALPPQTAVCVEQDDHQIGESCDDTICQPGFECEESFVYLPCNGRGCEEPVDVHVSCEPVPEHIIGETCDETTCDEGYECWEYPAVICQGPGCDDTCQGPGCDEDEPEFIVSCERETSVIGTSGDPIPWPSAD